MFRGKEERSFAGNSAFSDLCILGFSANFPFVFSLGGGGGGGNCCELLQGVGVILSRRGSDWFWCGVLDAGRKQRSQV